MQERINRKFIVNYLLMAGNSSRGATVKDIMGATGLGKSTVYRVINKTPAIKRVEMPGKTAQYYVDAEEWNKHSEKAPTKTAKIKGDPEGFRIPVEGQQAAYIMCMSVFEFSERSTGYTKSGKQDEDKAALVAVMNNSIDFQNGVDSFNPELAKRARIAIERMENYHLFMYLWLLAQRQKKEFLSDENFWALWPKD